MAHQLPRHGDVSHITHGTGCAGRQFHRLGTGKLPSLHMQGQGVWLVENTKRLDCWGKLSH